MKHLFVPYELALKLKEKGFDEPCILYFSSGMLQLNQPATMFGWKNKDLIELDSYDRQTNERLLAPLYQQVIDWFREKHGIMIACIEDTIPEGDTGWKQGLYSYVEYMDGYKSNIKSSDRISFSNDSYYNLLNKAIEEALKLI